MSPPTIRQPLAVGLDPARVKVATAKPMASPGPRSPRRHEPRHLPSRLEHRHRQGISLDSGILAEVCLRVGIVCRSDIASFGIQDDQQAGGTRLGAEPREGTDSAPTMAFVKGGLRLDESHRIDRHSQDNVDKAFQTFGAVIKTPVTKDFGSWIKAPYQGTLTPLHGSKSLRKGLDHWMHDALLPFLPPR
jgi:hypothetical protein